MMFRKPLYISGWQIRISGLRLKAWNKVCFSSVYMTNKSGYIIHVHDIMLLFSIRALISTFNIKRSITGLFADQIQISNPGADLKESDKHDSDKEKGTARFNWDARLYSQINRLIDMLFTVTTKHIAIRKILLTVDQAGSTGSLIVEEVNLFNGSLSGSCTIQYKQITGTFPFSATIDQPKKKVDIASNGFGISINNVACFFAGMCQGSCIIEKTTTFTRLNIVLGADQLNINHPAFSSSPVFIAKSSVDLGLVISKERLEVCRESEVAINDIPVLFQFVHEAQDADLIKYILVVVIEGRQFFKSYPFFNNSGLAAIQAEGEMVIQVSYMLSMTDFSNYYFKSEILRDNFHVSDLGPFVLSNKYVANLIKCGSFHDVDTLTGHVDYVRLSDIPTYFTDVVVTAEDPNFYSHSGVDPYFIGVAIAENLCSRRFKKGASTITMQLCKNIYFYNDKCISRKMDEMIVAWLLERFLHLSKEQILETYLNIIEFAEDVYGIKAAAIYYFNKEVAGMNLLECITMSYVIPRPKFFLEALLMRSPKLLVNLRRHIDYHLRKLHNNGKISKETFLGTDYSIKFELNAFNNEIITLQL
jgi:hypothetical protein